MSAKTMILFSIVSLFFSLHEVAGRGMYNTGPRFIQGDIRVLPKGERRSSLSNPEFRWEDGKVYYKVASTFTPREKTLINAAMETIQAAATCIKFIERTNEDYWLYINNEDEEGGCSSYVGCLYMPNQIVNLAPDCFSDQSTTVHELMHALGFIHEQSRPDRDDYIQVLPQNIRVNEAEGETLEGNMQDFDITLLGVNDFDTRYDYKSLMHYEWDAFSRRPGELATILTLDGARIQRADRLSETDIFELKKLYGCQPNAACVDKRRRCKRVVRNKRCNYKRIQKFVKRNCRKSCKLC